MSRLNKLIDREMEKDSPALQSVVLRSSDGSEISEDNITIDIFNKPSPDVGQLVEVEKNFELLDTITNLTNLLRKMRSEGESKESMTVIADAINTLAGTGRKDDISLESGDYNLVYIDSTISQEGFWDVVKAIFRTIRDIIVGFFKALWSMIKSIFTYSEGVDRVSKSNGNRIKRIIDGDLTLDPEDAKPIKTAVGVLAGCPDTGERDPIVIVRYADAMYDHFVDFVNENSVKMLESIDKDFIPALNDVIRTLNSDNITTGTIDEFKNHVDRIVSLVDGMRYKFTPYSVPKSAPGLLVDKAREEMGVTEEYQLFSAIDTNDDRQTLSRNYNILGVFSKNISNWESLEKLTPNGGMFLYKQYRYADEHYTVFKQDVMPISDPKDLERLHNKQQDSVKKINFKKLNDHVKRITDGVTRITEYMSEIGCINLEGIKTVVELRSDLDEALIVIYESIDTPNKYEFVIDQAKKNSEFAKNPYYQFIDDAVFRHAFVKSHDRVTRNDIDGIKGTKEQKIEFIELCRRFNMIGASDFVTKTSMQKSSKSDTDMWEATYEKITDFLKKGMIDFSKITSAFGGDVEKLFVEYNAAVVEYVQKSAEQYR